MNVKQYRDNILIPTLKDIGMFSPSAVELLLRTALHESGMLEYIEQVGGGPALGFFQMEPPTLDDLITNLQPKHIDKTELLYSYKPPKLGWDAALCRCLVFQVVACRLQYWRFPEPLPRPGDAEGMWRYYRKYWNSSKGKARKKPFHEAWERYRLL